MSKQPNFGKSLAGYTPLGGAILNTLGDSVAAIMSSGLTLNNVSIVGGTIDGVTTGESNAGPTYVTNFYSGSPGTGYTGCFYGNTPGESACWNPVTGTWIVSGDLKITQTAEIGNLKMENNTLSSLNPNGNIFIDPLGTGILQIIAPITQSTPLGNLTFQTSNGYYSLETSTTNTLTSGTNTNVNTNNGDITLQTGLAVPTKHITFITTGVTSVTVTTSTDHGLLAGDKVTITGTDSIPDGIYTVSSVFSNTTFSVPISTPILTTGTTGDVLKHNNINLNASNNIYIPEDIKLTFGEISDIYNDGTNTIMDTGTGNFTINGDLLVNGDTTYVTSTVVSIDDPVFNVGGIDPLIVSDNMDRGISGKYYDTTSKILFFGKKDSSGCFTYIPDATEITPNVFTGTAGCAAFGGVTTTGITITNSGTITGLTTLTVPTLDTCNLSCTGTMNITGTTGITLTAPTVTTTGNLTSTGVITGPSANITGNISGGSSTITGNTTTGTLNSGNTTITGTLTSCNISCSGIMTITGATSINLTTPIVNTTGNLGVTGNITGANATISGTTTTTTATVTGTTTTNALNVTTNATVTGTTTTGTLSVTNNTHLYGNLLVDGTTNLQGTTATTINASTITATTSITAPILTSTATTNVVDLNITGTVTGLPFVGLTTEHLSVLGGNAINPSATINMTFINITSSGIATGVLPNGTSDGMQKYIFISSTVSGGTYKLTATSNYIDSGTGTTTSKVLTFKKAGYSIFLIWDNINFVWLAVNGGVCIGST